MNSKQAKATASIISAAFFFALMAAFVHLAGDLPAVQKSFFRNFVAFIFAAAVLLRSEEKFKINKSSIGPLLMRSVFGTMGILGNFYAVDTLMLSDASMLNKLSPFFAIIFSYFLLKERMTLIQGVSVIIAFIGSLFIIKPSGAGMLSPGAIAGLLGGFGAGVAYTFVRILGKRGERSAVIVFFFSAFSCLVTVPFLIFDYHPMTLKQLAFLISAGLSAALAQFSITTAYSLAPAKEISVFDYTQVIFAAILGFFLFGQMPDIYSVLGYIIICGVSVFMFMYNKVHDVQA